MRLRLQSFDGPLDVLLHLIKVQELNIFNIPIALVTEQFLSFLHMVPELDFQIAGEYLAMAAQLIEIKTSLLIPALQNKLPENIQALEDIPEDDPRKQLVQLLLEYESIRIAAQQLEASLQGTPTTFAPKQYKRLLEEFKHIEAPIVGDAFSLTLSLERVLLNLANKDFAPRVKVLAQRITIQSKMLEIKIHFEAEPNEYFCTLKEFLWKCEDRYELIVTLMAVLELSKAGHLFISQQNENEQIFLKRGLKFHEDAPELLEESAAKETKDSAEAHENVFAKRASAAKLRASLEATES
jgi:segregation and condensation protein A